MFPLHQSQDKCFQISFNPHQSVISEDLILSHVSVDGHDCFKNSGKLRRKKLLKSLGNFHGNHDDSDEIHKNKMMHREREKQRRQEMGSLCTSLRTLLPLEFIKGKRAISDQMNGAENYIRHQKKRIKEMEEKRDELKKLYNSNSFANSKEKTPICSFKMYFSRGVLQIMITSNGSHGFPLSRILRVLVEEKLEVFNCGSSTVNDKSIHTIQIEVSDSTSLDLPQLEKTLTEAVPMLREIRD